jgi:ABC-type multidrug transport system fused ATPase/permease subunit
VDLKIQGRELMKKYFKTNLGKIIWILLFTFLSVGMISIIPLTTKYIIDSYQDLNVTKILILGGIYVLAIVLFLVFEYLKKIGNVSFQKAVCKELKEDLFN